MEKKSINCRKLIMQKYINKKIVIGDAMVLILNDSTLDIAPEDYSLTEPQQKIILSIHKRPKTVKEISEEGLNLSTVFKSLDELKNMDMVSSDKINIIQIINNERVTKKSDTNYWMLTKKGYVWAYNLAEAHNRPKEERKEILQVIREKCKGISAILL